MHLADHSSTPRGILYPTDSRPHLAAQRPERGCLSAVFGDSACGISLRIFQARAQVEAAPAETIGEIGSALVSYGRRNRLFPRVSFIHLSIGEQTAHNSRFIYSIVEHFPKVVSVSPFSSFITK